MLEKEIIYKKKKLAYKVLGMGQPVLLLHGFGETGAIWNDLAEKLSVRFKVIIPDLPGSGNSEEIDPIDGSEHVSINDYANRMHMIILNEQKDEKNNTGAINIVGHSMGGYIALAYSSLFPEFILKLVLFHSSCYADDEEKIVMRKKAIEFISKNGAYTFLQTSIPDLFSKRSKQIIPETINKLVANGKHFTPSVLIQYYNAMILRPERIEIVKNLDYPVLFIIGEEDKAVPLQISLRQCHLPKISSVTILKDVAHMGMLEKPDQSFSALNTFLTDL